MSNSTEKYSIHWIHDSLAISYDNKTYNLGCTLWWTLESILLRYNNFLMKKNLESSKDFLVMIADHYRELPRNDSYIEQTSKGVSLTHEKHKIDIGFNKSFVYSIKGVTKDVLDLIPQSIGTLVQPLVRDIKVPMELAAIFLKSTESILKQPELKPSIIKEFRGRTFVFYVENNTICLKQNDSDTYLASINNPINIAVKDIRDATEQWEDRPDLNDIDNFVVECVEYKRGNM